MGHVDVRRSWGRCCEALAVTLSEVGAQEGLERRVDGRFQAPLAVGRDSRELAPALGRAVRAEGREWPLQAVLKEA